MTAGFVLATVTAISAFAADVTLRAVPDTATTFSIGAQNMVVDGAYNNANVDVYKRQRYYLITNIPIIIEYLLARMMPYGPVTNPEITFSLGSYCKCIWFILSSYNFPFSHSIINLLQI